MKVTQTENIPNNLSHTFLRSSSMFDMFLAQLKHYRLDIEYVVVQPQNIHYLDITIYMP
jgi:hypothetical protein